MADAGVGEGLLIASLVASTGASIYAAQQAGQGPKLPKTPPPGPKAPTTDPAAMQQNQADIQARTAGGTILSGKGGAVGDAANSTRKSLLGT